MFIAEARFLCCERLSCIITTMPVGICVMRIADSVLLTCWPPAPCERMVSIRKSSLLMSTSTSSTSGSTATVAVLPEAAEVDIDIADEDLKIDTLRSGGAGGQHVNKTESAIRITHIPTGIVVMMQDSRSQHKNRASAMNILRSRIYDAERQRVDAARSADRKEKVGSGVRSERIRTYNFPQGRVTDHRINLTLHQLPQILDGDLDDLIGTLARESHAEALAALGDAP